MKLAIAIIIALFICYVMYGKQEGYPGGFPAKCDCPDCILATLSNTEQPQRDRLQCVRGDNGGPIIGRNMYLEWETEGAPFEVPVTSFDLGFYKF